MRDQTRSYGTGRILLQLTGCMKHEGFCAAFGENCPSLPKESWVNGSPPAATKLQPGADGWGKSGDAVCAHRTRNPGIDACVLPVKQGVC